MSGPAAKAAHKRRRTVGDDADEVAPAAGGKSKGKGKGKGGGGSALQKLVGVHEKTTQQFLCMTGILIYLPVEFYLIVEAAAVAWKQTDGWKPGLPHPSGLSCAETRFIECMKCLIKGLKEKIFTLPASLPLPGNLGAMDPLNVITQASTAKASDLKAQMADFEYRASRRDTEDSERALRPYLLVHTLSLASVLLRNALLKIEGGTTLTIRPYTGTSKHGPLARAALGTSTRKPKEPDVDMTQPR